MTPERAIKIQRLFQSVVENNENQKAFEIAIKALERQIPKEPENGNACPVCRTEVKYYYVGENSIFDLPILVKDRFCTNCGQKIDWSKSDD